MEEVIIGLDNYEEWPDLLTPADVAKLNRVDPKTVSRWAAAGKLKSIRTPGNQYRFTKEEVKRVLDEGTE